MSKILNQNNFIRKISIDSQESKIDQILESSKENFS